MVLKELILEGVVVLEEHMEMHREALGTYKGVFEHMGVLGHQGTSGGV